MSKNAIPSMSIERLSAAAAAIETIAQNNKLMLEQHYGTSASDVMALVSLARQKWYEQNGRR